MKCVIVDDDHIFIEQLKAHLNHTFQDIQIDMYDSFCDDIYTKEYQCIFLDVMLKEGESFEYGMNISKLYPHAIIVYISSVDHFVYESFQQNTFFFIRKSHFDEDYDFASHAIPASVPVLFIVLLDQVQRSFSQKEFI